MYGLAQVAQSKGLIVAGMKLSTNELRHNMIVHVIKDGTPHYSVVREVTENRVKLADPSLCNIEMTREKFNEIYNRNAIVISDPNMEAPGVSENLTTEEMETIKEQQLSASANMQLTAEEMQGIRGKGTRRRRRRRRDVDSPRRMTREQRRQRREGIHRDIRTIERFGIGGVKIVGGGIAVAAAKMGWNPTGRGLSYFLG